ncbi:MAG: rhodanese-like domain-containing protein [Acidobacteria bacterium]|nr:rhodanese-like domain-containing protein [Acidobacteriota bacterium]MCA1639137.1 rhodanese-like domain-containing protein [Acidobacteriota bacterium]
MKQNGYENAYALVGGTAAWKNAGFPMEQGEQK